MKTYMLKSQLYPEYRNESWSETIFTGLCMVISVAIVVLVVALMMNGVK